MAEDDVASGTILRRSDYNVFVERAKDGGAVVEYSDFELYQKYVTEIVEDQMVEMHEKLIQSPSDKAFQQNIETEIKAGKPRKQAIAIAYDIKRKNESMQNKLTEGAFKSTAELHYSVFLNKDTDSDDMRYYDGNFIERVANSLKDDKQIKVDSKTHRSIEFTKKLPDVDYMKETYLQQYVKGIVKLIGLAAIANNNEQAKDMYSKVNEVDLSINYSINASLAKKKKASDLGGLLYKVRLERFKGKDAIDLKMTKYGETSNITEVVSDVKGIFESTQITSVSSNKLNEDKQKLLKQMAYEDVEYDQVFDRDDFDTFKEMMYDQGYDITEKDLEDYYEYVKEAQTELNYKDASEDELRKMGAFDNLHENTITSTLPPVLDKFLMDMAQMYCDISYDDIMKFAESATKKDLAELTALRKDLGSEFEEDDPEVQEIFRAIENLVKGSLHEAVEPKTCVICNQEYTGYGNNAEPVAKGYCCDKCNMEKVIPARLCHVNESLDTAREKAQELRKHSDAEVILYAYRDKKGNLVELEPEELTMDEYQARVKEITDAQTKLSDKDPRGNRYGYQKDMMFYALYKGTVTESVSVEPKDNGYHDLWELTDRYAVHNDGGRFYVFDRDNGNTHLFISDSIDEVNNYIKDKLELDVVIEPSTRVFKKKSIPSKKDIQKDRYLRDTAEIAWESGHGYDPDDFSYFKKVCKEDGYNVTEADFDKYFEYLDEIRSEQYDSDDLDESRLTDEEKFEREIEKLNRKATDLEKKAEQSLEKGNEEGYSYYKELADEIRREMDMKLATRPKTIEEGMKDSLDEKYYAVIQVDGEERRFPFDDREQAREYIAKAQRGELPEFEGKKIQTTFTEGMNGEYVVMGVTTNGNKVYYNADTREWADKADDATIFTDMDIARDSWSVVTNGGRKLPDGFRRIFVPNYNKQTMNEDWNIGSNKVVPFGSDEHIKLMDLAQKLEDNSPNGYKYEVRTTYEDFGANMQWTTIICYDKKGDSWQVLHTKEWLDLANGKSVDEVYQEVTTDKYFQDKEKEYDDMNLGELFDSMD